MQNSCALQEVNSIFIEYIFYHYIYTDKIIIKMQEVVYNIFIKILFFVCLVLHVVLWPSVFTITFASAVALEGLITYFSTEKSELYQSITGRGAFFLHGSHQDAPSVRRYVFTALVGIYFSFYFVQYTSLQINTQPRMTNWIHPDRILNYSFGDNRNNILPDLEVTDARSKEMRDNKFIWPRTHEDAALMLNGNLREARPLLDGNDLQLENLRCFPGNADTNYSCYASNLVKFEVPDSNLYGEKYKVVPMSSQFYVVDVKITPKSGIMACRDLEVYRIIVNGDNQVIYSLDYPASSLPPTPSSKSSSDLTTHCGLFGDPLWCLRYAHAFTREQYKAKVASKCAENDGSLIFRLPVRSVDINPLNGKTDLDALIVSKFADVKVKFTWHYEEPSMPPMIRSLAEWDKSENDQAQEWRDSSTDTGVFFKFAVATTPLLIIWYLLAREFPYAVSNTNQVAFLSIFVLFPSILIFLSVGAWLPMAGSIVCAIAINHSPSTHVNEYSFIRMYFRPILFFITAVCNSIQFVWVIVLISQAGWPAFYYDYSIKQLSELSSNFIISDYTSPSCIGLMMPISLTVNLTMMIGASIGIVLELLPYYSYTK